MWQQYHEASKSIHNAQGEIHGLYLQQSMEECAQDISSVRLHNKEYNFNNN